MNFSEAEGLAAEIRADGDYMDVRVLPDGSIAYLYRLITTVAIHLGVDRNGWTRRFCYADERRAWQEYQALQTEDDEPTGWIARRPEQPCELTSSLQSSRPSSRPHQDQ